MVDPSILFSAILLVVCLTAFLARRSTLRRERAGLLLSDDSPTSESTSFSLLRESLRGRTAKPMSRRVRLLFHAAIGLAVFMFTRNPIIAILPWPVTAGAQRLLEAHRRRKSNKNKDEQVLELIDSLNQSLRSGLSLQQSLEVSLEDVGEEMRGEMLTVLKDLGLGSGLEEALSKAAGLSPNPSLKLTFTVLGLLHGKGGDLPRILERMRKRVAEGLEVRREARILTSQSRASGYLVSCLPPVFLALQAVLNPNSLRPLLSTSVGNLMVAVAAGLNIAAFFLIRRIVSPEG